jgi:hypothetical protein
LRTSTNVAHLIREAQLASTAAGEASDVARQRALSPRLVAGQVAAARKESEDAAFNRNRLQEVVRRLGERLVEVREREERSRRRAARDADVAERDTLAAELAEVYPPLAEQLADLAARIAANDVEIARLRGVDGIEGAESKARGSGTGSFLRITEALRLPAFKNSGVAPYLWPLR